MFFSWSFLLKTIPCSLCFRKLPTWRSPPGIYQCNHVVKKLENSDGWRFNELFSNCFKLTGFMQKSNILDKIYWLESIVTFDYSQKGCKSKERAISKEVGYCIHIFFGFAFLELGALLVNSRIVRIKRAWQLFLLFFRSEIHLIQKWWTNSMLTNGVMFPLKMSILGHPAIDSGKKLRKHPKSLQTPPKNISEKNHLQILKKLKPEMKKKWGNNFFSNIFWTSRIQSAVNSALPYTLGWSSLPPQKKKKQSTKLKGQVSESQIPRIFCFEILLGPIFFWLQKIWGQQN